MSIEHNGSSRASRIRFGITSTLQKESVDCEIAKKHDREQEREELVLARPQNRGQIEIGYLVRHQLQRGLVQQVSEVNRDGGGCAACDCDRFGPQSALHLGSVDKQKTQGAEQRGA